ncbi:MAG: invasion associated locus B family protein [Bdellovibrionales bacterium]|nr:invasion associated locus B family protein [Bdellovibrionales bacterium]
MKNTTVITKSFRSLLAAGGFAALLMSGAAMASTQTQSLGAFGDWKAHSFVDGGGKVCFMTSEPQKSEANVKGVNRGKIAFFVTHWAADKTKNVISVSMGYPLKEGTPVTVTVDGKTFALATNLSNKPEEAEMAWAADQATDDALAAALQKGSRLVVKGTSRRGTLTTDTYSLKGTGASYRAISQDCGV